MDVFQHVLCCLIHLFTPPLSKFKTLFLSSLDFFRWKRNPLMDIPGPFSIPIFGSSWLYSWFGPYTMTKYHEANMDKYRRYGPVVRENVIWNFPLIHLFDRSDIHTILSHKSKYPLRPPNEADVYYRISRPDIYNNIGMVNLNGPMWHRLRSVLTKPLTNSTTPTAYLPHMNLIAEDFAECIRETATERNDYIITNFKDLVYRVGLETVCNVALERRMGFLDTNRTKKTDRDNDNDIDTIDILHSIQEYQNSSNDALYGLPWWKYVPTPFSKAFTSLVKHKDYLFKTFGSMIDENLSRMNKYDQDDDDDNYDQSIINQLLRSSRRIDMKDVKASVVDYITAGVDTIGNSIIFVLLLLAKYPDKRRKLQREIDSVLGGTSEDVTKEKIREMKYLRACITESFRLLPTASQIARIIEENVTVSGGYVLPPGTVVLCHHRIASLQNSNFTKAEEFIPERWLNDQEDFEYDDDDDDEGQSGMKGRKNEIGSVLGSDYAHAKELVKPFGAGKRICPGKKLAEQEIYIVTAKVMQAFDLSLCDDFDVEFRFLLTPSSHGLKVRATPRHAN